MKITIYFKDSSVKSYESIDQLRENDKDFEIFMYDWKDELFCCNKFKKDDIASLVVR